MDLPLLFFAVKIEVKSVWEASSLDPGVELTLKLVDTVEPESIISQYHLGLSGILLGFEFSILCAVMIWRDTFTSYSENRTGEVSHHSEGLPGWGEGACSDSSRHCHSTRVSQPFCPGSKAEAQRFCLVGNINCLDICDISCKGGFHFIRVLLTSRLGEANWAYAIPSRSARQSVLPLSDTS